MEYKHIETRTEGDCVKVLMQDEKDKKHVVMFTQAKRGDSYGNPRLIIHFLSFLNGNERGDGGRELNTLQLYEIAKKRAKAAGFSAYRGRDYVGGFIAQGWFPDHLAENVLKQIESK